MKVMSEKRRRQFVVCPYCDQPIDREVDEWVQKGERAYHTKCFQEKQDRNELCNYICRLFGLKAPGPHILSQITNFHNCGYTYAGMRLSLVYFYEVQYHNPDQFKSRDTIGIIPHIYEQAKEYYTNIENQKTTIAETVFNSIVEPKKQIIKQPKREKPPLYEFE